MRFSLIRIAMLASALCVLMDRPGLARSQGQITSVTTNGVTPGGVIRQYQGVYDYWAEEHARNHIDAIADSGIRWTTRSAPPAREASSRRCACGLWVRRVAERLR